MTWASGADICRRLKGRWATHHGSCCCPAHQDSTPSLSVTETRDGRILLHCFAGCRQLDVIDALRKLGLWGNSPLTRDDANNPFYLTTRRDDAKKATKLERQSEAQAIWDKCRSAKGTHAEAYLRARGIRTPIPDEIRFHPELLFSPTKQKYPAMVARLSDNSGFCAIQRTYLDHKEPKKADIESPKRTKGAMLGAAVRLRPAGTILGLAEGIETALSARQIFSIPTWATLSAMRLSKIDIPPGVEHIMLFADAGKVGRDEAFKASDHYEQCGFRTEVITPQAHFSKADSDFNDSLQGQQ